MIDITLELIQKHLSELTHSVYIHILFWLVAFDVVTGYAKGFKLKQFDSKVGTNGMIRHVLVFMLMLIVGVYSRALGYEGVSVSLCLFFIANYFVSVMENWEALNLPFPDSIKPFFRQMRKRSDEKLADSLKVGLLQVEEIKNEEE